MDDHPARRAGAGSTAVMVAGAGFEPAKAYADGFTDRSWALRQPAKVRKQNTVGSMVLTWRIARLRRREQGRPAGGRQRAQPGQGTVPIRFQNTGTAISLGRGDGRRDQGGHRERTTTFDNVRDKFVKQQISLKAFGKRDSPRVCRARITRSTAHLIRAQPGERQEDCQDHPRQKGPRA